MKMPPQLDANDFCRCFGRFSSRRFEESVEQLTARLPTTRTELEAVKTEVASAQRELKALELRLSFNPKLPPRCCCQSWSAPERKLASVLQRGERCGEDGQGAGMYDSKLLSIAVGRCTTNAVRAADSEQKL